MDTTTIVLVINIGISAYALHKIRKIHISSFHHSETLRKIEEETRTLYSQIQAYQDLISLIKPRRPLPPLRGWAGSPDFLLHVASHALEHKPTTIVECSSGSSTIVLARCCELNGSGHVYSLEHDAEFAIQTRARLHEQGLDAWATVIHAPLIPYQELNGQQWYSKGKLAIADKSIDFLVIDGPPTHIAPLARHPALPLLHSRIAPGCTVMLDDAGRDDEIVTVKRWISEYPNFSHTVLPAEKGCVKLTETTAAP